MMKRLIYLTALCLLPLTGAMAQDVKTQKTTTQDAAAQKDIRQQPAQRGSARRMVPFRSTTARTDSLGTEEASIDSMLAQELRGEQRIIDSKRTACKRQFTHYIETAIEGALRSLMGGFLPEGQQAIVKRYQGLCAAQLPMGEMKKLLAPQVNATIAEVNGLRKATITLAAGHAVSGGYGVDGFKYQVIRNAVECPVADLMRMQQLQRQVNWRALGLKADDVVPDGSGARLLRGQDLMPAALVNKNEETKKIGPTVNRIARQLAWLVSKSVYRSIDQVFDVVAQKVSDSQPRWSSQLMAAGR